MNATSSPARELLVLRTFIWRNSITFFHSSRWSLCHSVKRIVLSSQQVNEDQPTTSRLCWSVPLTWCGDRSVALWSDLTSGLSPCPCRTFLMILQAQEQHLS